jgi:hypothetical protein
MSLGGRGRAVRQHQLNVSGIRIHVRAKAIDGFLLVDLIGSLHLTSRVDWEFCPEPITGSGRRAVALKTQFSTKNRTSPEANRKQQCCVLHRELMMRFEEVIEWLNRFL